MALSAKVGQLNRDESFERAGKLGEKLYLRVIKNGSEVTFEGQHEKTMGWECENTWGYANGWFQVETTKVSDMVKLCWGITRVERNYIVDRELPNGWNVEEYFRDCDGKTHVRIEPE